MRMMAWTHVVVDVVSEHECISTVINAVTQSPKIRK